MPRLGQTMEAGTVVRWLKAVGVPFELGEDLYEVSTEKVEVAVEAKAAGTLLHLVVAVGEEVDVGTVLAVVGAPGEGTDPLAIRRLLEVAGIVAAAPGGLPRADAPVPMTEFDEAAIPAASPLEPPSPVSPEAGQPSPGRLRVIPRARILAARLGIDLASVPGTGPRGRITVADVSAAAGDRADVSAAAGDRADVSAPPEGPAELERHRLSGVQLSITEAFASSWSTIPQFTQTVVVDCSALLARRAAEAASWETACGIRPSLSHYLVHAVVSACRSVPDANARLEGDEVVTFADVNPAVAVAGTAGLLAPVLRRAHLMDLGQVALGLRDLAERGRQGALSHDDLAGGTIAVSNLGMYGVDAGTSTVISGQAVMVFAGSLKERPLAVDGLLCVRPTLYLTMAADHRVIDGLTGSLFLTAVRDELELAR
jgi:pyruvate dehydrogenase E2 component (dihydrolipoamide acetyltransferase)